MHSTYGHTKMRCHANVDALDASRFLTSFASVCRARVAHAVGGTSVACAGMNLVLAGCQQLYLWAGRLLQRP